MFVKRLHSTSLKEAIKAIGSDKSGQKIMNKKGEILLFEIKNLSFQAGNILKQEALSAGGDFATPRDFILAKKSCYDGILIATKSQLEKILLKCKIQPFGLKDLAKEISSHIKNTHDSLKLPKIMTILNVTPDSFFEQSRFSSKNAIERIYSLIQKGINFIDIGAASSRPGSDLIDYQTEIKRLEAIIQEIKNQNLFKKAIFSIDTYNPQTAEFALKNGFKVVNDVSGYQHPDMARVTAQYGGVAILMHSKGTPKIMQNLTDYTDLFQEVDEFFQTKIQWLQSCGVGEIVLDVGFGFAKNKVQNLSLIKHLKHFSHFGYPLLVGASRKTTIGILTQREVKDRLAGTLALHLIALQNGADILRVHDEDAHLDILKIHQAFQELP